ncbi:CENP a CENPA-CAD centromere complex subunit domain-containing protein [Fusarium heterosporum]|uniref:CENP a CENPA-CAD centromere complex subunit domain-containing protein n=1 Tax=Fusarium heterosporum TaxID=42747 RepID=A0A8H5WZU9_FUSHE|nr:CENP a CENPA-CAD centromere complex subunit domain-containing protein [Fusarium heterosporum]
MTFTDEELDRDWQPSGRRPQSTIARSFSAELMDIFRIENSLTDLDQQVHAKKQTVDKNAEELASLEARLREMEDRLRRSGVGPQTQTTPNQAQHQHQQQQPGSLDAPKDDSKARSRPGTARASQQAPSSANMPPTPGASEGEYYVVTRDDLQDGPR